MPNIRHTYLKESEENHKCSICSDSQTHTWKYDSTGTTNEEQHTVKCEGCGTTKLVDHTYDQDGNKCVCGQVKPAESKTATIEYTGETANMTGNGTNDAYDIFGLKANVFNITSEKNSGSVQVGLNKEGSIRLHKNEAVTLKISVTSDFEIEKIKVTLLAGANKGKCAEIGSLKVIKGSDTIVSGDNGEYVINDTSISLSNTDDTNPICIKSIVITYKRVNGVDPATYPITINCDSQKGDYSTDPKYVGEVEENTEIKLTITPKPGWQVKSVMCNGEPLSLEETYYKFTVTQAMTIEVEFEEHVVSSSAKWVLLTDVANLNSGDKIIFVSPDNKYAVGGKDSAGNRLLAISLSDIVSGNAIIADYLPEEVVQFTTSKSGSNWEFTCTAGKLGVTSVDNPARVNFTNSTTTTWTLSNIDGNDQVQIKSTKAVTNQSNKGKEANLFRFYNTSGSLWFSNYKSNTTGAKDPFIYVYTEE